MNEALSIRFYTTPAESIPVGRSQSRRPARSPLAWVHCLVREAGSPNLVNFPCAITFSMMLTVGVAAFGWGAILMNAWLALFGFVVILVVGLLYGLIHWEG
jgi:hypothetical protein